LKQAGVIRFLRRHGADDEEIHEYIERRVDTPTSCSCWFCGNPRRYSGKPTIQERLADEAMEAQLEAVGYG
jgi:hypothetical protein